MTLQEFLEQQDPRARISDGHAPRSIEEALTDYSDSRLQKIVRTGPIRNPERTIIWHFDAPELIGVWYADSGNAEPNYLLSPVRKAGRPRTRQGDYETVTVDIRKDLLERMDASNQSRREYIEERLEK